MGLRLELDATDKIVRLSFQGVVTDHALLAGYAALRDGSASYGVCRCIVDYTGATKIELSNRLSGWLLTSHRPFPQIVSR